MTKGKKLMLVSRQHLSSFSPRNSHTGISFHPSSSWRHPQAAPCQGLSPPWAQGERIPSGHCACLWHGPPEPTLQGNPLLCGAPVRGAGSRHLRAAPQQHRVTQAGGCQCRQPLWKTPSPALHRAKGRGAGVGSSGGCAVQDGDESSNSHFLQL